MENSIFKGLDVLFHASYCYKTECEFDKCSKMKGLLYHLEECKEKIYGNCVVCKEMIALICRHSRNCGSANCKIPFCLVMKDNMDLISDDSSIESISPERVKNEVNNNSGYRDYQQKGLCTKRYSDPILKESRLSSISVKTEVDNSSYRTNKSSMSQFPFSSKFQSVNQHFSFLETHSRMTECQPSTSGYQKRDFPSDERNNSFKMRHTGSPPNDYRSMYAAKRSRY